MLDFYAREPHHKIHAQAIADGFGVQVTDDLKCLTNDYVCVFSYGDLRQVDMLGKKIIFADHGVGMFYNNEHPSYAGSLKHRENVILRLSPNEIHASRERQILKCPVEIIGIPKLDKFANKHWRIKKFQPTVAVSFHWDCFVNPETRSSWKYYENILPLLKDTFHVYGHAHPRISRLMQSVYRKYGIVYKEDFDEIMRKADVYICDNSSTIFEWCITEKPIVLINSPFYRRNVEHIGNPRFWKYSDISPTVNKPSELIPAIQDAIKNHNAYLPRIKEAKSEVLYITDGTATQKAIEIIKKHICHYQ